MKSQLNKNQFEHLLGAEFDPLNDGTPLLKIDSSVQPQMKIYFFNVTNPSDFLEGEKPIFHEIGPYVYNEKWVKVNLTWHPNRKCY